MSSVTLISTDLDGTLLNSMGEISARNVGALREAARRGIGIIINTGRMFASAKRFSAELGLDTSVICYNGAMIRGPRDETLSHMALDMDIARRLLAIFRERNMYVQSYIDDVLLVKDQNEDEARGYMRFYGVEGSPVGDEIYNPRTAPTKLLAVTSGTEESHGLMDELSRLFGPSLYVTRSNSEFVEMMNPAANKGRALARLASEMRVPLESVMALGDGENDIEMLRLAGIGVAMKNAREAVRDAADVTAPSNNEDGVAWAVEKYAL
ncbi:MAG: Cof-type HAD-IIB family hydrolase [Synergistaceae bacterium]|jgi:Cof subfamily protein (haloacid dehalogenase superfamily)|nr:Cof-type HAD-IIB family hydrolase [Synergistaceae bacterium]